MIYQQTSIDANFILYMIHFAFSQVFKVWYISTATKKMKRH